MKKNENYVANVLEKEMKKEGLWINAIEGQEEEVIICEQEEIFLIYGKKADCKLLIGNCVIHKGSYEECKTWTKNMSWNAIYMVIQAMLMLNEKENKQ